MKPKVQPLKTILRTLALIFGIYALTTIATSRGYWRHGWYALALALILLAVSNLTKQREPESPKPENYKLT